MRVPCADSPSIGRRSQNSLRFVAADVRRRKAAKCKTACLPRRLRNFETSGRTARINDGSPRSFSASNPVNPLNPVQNSSHPLFQPVPLHLNSRLSYRGPPARRKNTVIQVTNRWPDFTWPTIPDNLAAVKKLTMIALIKNDELSYFLYFVGDTAALARRLAPKTEHFRTKRVGGPKLDP